MNKLDKSKLALEKLLEFLKKLFSGKGFSMGGGSSFSPKGEAGGQENADEGKLIDRVLDNEDKQFLENIKSEIDSKIKEAIENDSFGEQYQWESLKFAVDNIFNENDQFNPDFDAFEFAEQKQQDILAHIQEKYGTEDAKAEIAYEASMEARQNEIFGGEEKSKMMKDFNAILAKHAPKGLEGSPDMYDANDVTLRHGLHVLAHTVDMISSEQYLANSPEWIKTEQQEASASENSKMMNAFLGKVQDQGVEGDEQGRVYATRKSDYESTFSS